MLSFHRQQAQQRLKILRLLRCTLLRLPRVSQVWAHRPAHIMHVVRRTRGLQWLWRIRVERTLLLRLHRLPLVTLQRLALLLPMRRVWDIVLTNHRTRIQCRMIRLPRVLCGRSLLRRAQVKLDTEQRLPTQPRLRLVAQGNPTRMLGTRDRSCLRLRGRGFSRLSWRLHLARLRESSRRDLEHQPQLQSLCSQQRLEWERPTRRALRTVRRMQERVRRPLHATRSCGSKRLQMRALVEPRRIRERRSSLHLNRAQLRLTNHSSHA